MKIPFQHKREDRRRMEDKNTCLVPHSFLAKIGLGRIAQDRETTMADGAWDRNVQAHHPKAIV